MSFLNLDGGSGSDHIVEKLVLERTRRAAKGVGFDAVDVDEAILQAAVLLFRDRQQQHLQPQQQQQQQQQQQRSAFTIDNNGRRIRRHPQPPAANNQNATGSDVKLEKLCINNCPANPFLEYLIEASMGMDLFREFELQGNIEEEEEQAAEREQQRSNTSDSNGTCNDNSGGADDMGDGGDGNENGESGEDGPQTTNIFAIDALGFRMRFSKRLRKVELINLPITRDHAESLMYGIETNDINGTGCRLDSLVMEGVRFVDAIDQEDETGDESEPAVSTLTPGDGTIVVKELSEGFPNNRTLETITLERCKLTDSQIALIFDSLARHPTLKHLNLSENSCRSMGLEALDRMLVSPPLWMPPGGNTKHNCCQLESLDLSYQFTSEETYRTGEHIQLNLLTRNCTASDTDTRVYPNLRKLVMQGNQIDDSDMKYLAFLIRYRFPHLEELDLRFNEITTQGLEVFANLTDSNNNMLPASIASTKNDGSYGANVAANKKHKDHFPFPSSRLRTIRLTNNPLVMSNQTSIIILKLLKIHPELQLIQSNLEWEDGTSIARYIQHLLDINRAGRVLLLTGNSTGDKKNANSNSDDAVSARKPSASSVPASIALPIDEGASVISSITLPPEEEHRRRKLRQQRRPLPLGAWPLVLARLTRKTRYPHYIPLKNSLNGMYYLIRHGPILVEQMAARKSYSDASNTTIASSTKSRSGSKKTKEVYRKRKWGDPALGGYETLADFLRYEM